MITEQLNALKKTLLEQGKMFFLEGATEEQIALFEKKNGIIFPQKYKEWLQLSDGGECFLPAGVQFYGVAHKPLIDIADKDIPSENYCVIGVLSSGDPILFEKDSERIAVYNHEDGVIEDDEVYEDFFAFLADLHSLLGIGE